MPRNKQQYYMEEEEEESEVSEEELEVTYTHNTQHAKHEKKKVKPTTEEVVTITETRAKPQPTETVVKRRKPKTTLTTTRSHPPHHHTHAHQPQQAPAQWYFQNDPSLNKGCTNSVLDFPYDYQPYDDNTTRIVDGAYRQGRDHVDVGPWVLYFNSTVDVNGPVRRLVPHPGEHCQVRKGTREPFERFRAVYDPNNLKYPPPGRTTSLSPPPAPARRDPYPYPATYGGETQSPYLGLNRIPVAYVIDDEPLPPNTMHPQPMFVQPPPSPPPPPMVQHPTPIELLEGPPHTHHHHHHQPVTIVPGAGRFGDMPTIPMGAAADILSSTRSSSPMTYVEHHAAHFSPPMVGQLTPPPRSISPLPMHHSMPPPAVLFSQYGPPGPPPHLPPPPIPPRVEIETRITERSPYINPAAQPYVCMPLSPR